MRWSDVMSFELLVLNLCCFGVLFDMFIVFMRFVGRFYEFNNFEDNMV